MATWWDPMNVMYVALIRNAQYAFNCSLLQPRNIPNIVDFSTVTIVKKEVNLLQHRCYLQRVDEDDEDDNKTTFINFDIEARQDEGNHIANLLFAETTLDDTQYTFKGENCVTEFFSWVHSLANDENTEKTVVVAHNFKGYDGYFILEELYRQHATNLNQIVNGPKFLVFKFPM